jgi:hypothetical protein
MMTRVSLLFLPILAFAQEAPPEVDQELRARVSAFYQNFLADSFSPRKAEVFVAEDTKDYFYNATKYKYESFTINKITYDDNLKKAVVNVSGKMERLIAGQKVMMDVPQDTHWKIEDGKWCWTYNPADYSITPFGGKNPPPATAPEPGTAAVKPKDTSPEAIRAAGLSVLQQQTMGVDKTMVTVNVDQVSSVEVVFTNGADGELQVALDGPMVRGLTAKLDKMNVPGHGKAILTLHYDPSDKKSGKDIWEPKGSIEFRLIAAPFNRVFPVYVMFTASK